MLDGSEEPNRKNSATLAKKNHKASYLFRKFLRSSVSKQMKMQTADVAILTNIGDMMDKAKVENHGGEKVLYARQKSIADFARVSREHVGRCLKKYVQLKILKRDEENDKKNNKFYLGETILYFDNQ